MSITDRYVVVLAAMLLGTSVVFAWTGETRLNLFVSVYIIETLAVNQVFVWLSERARSALRVVERILVACFAVVVITEIVRILAG
jgi:heme/copper-type cytochrome/quinol oxidase subunit 4